MPKVDLGKTPWQNHTIDLVLSSFNERLNLSRDSEKSSPRSLVPALTSFEM